MMPSVTHRSLTYLSILIICSAFVYFTFPNKLQSQLISGPNETYILLKDQVTGNTTSPSNSNSNPFNATTQIIHSREPSLSNQQCQPKTKIGFSKTHKTASSTIQNILLRYGFEHQLDFVMLNGGNHLGRPDHQYTLTEPFDSAWVRQTPWHGPIMKEKGSYDIFALHAHWNQPEVEKLVTKAATFVTILRDPVDAFESLYTYANLRSQLYKMSLEDLITRLNSTPALRDIRMNGFMGLNHQLYDLGLTKDELTDPKAVARRIEEMDKQFDLVLISDMFDESIVLLAEELCWPWEAVASFKINARKESAKLKISPALRDELRKFQWADQTAYEHFKLRLHERIEAYGKDRMAESLRKLREANEKLKDRCMVKEVLDKKQLKGAYKPWSEQVYGYKVDEGDRGCRLVAMSENQFVDMVREYQKKRWTKKLFG